jgi:hypothetical protein
VVLGTGRSECTRHGNQDDLLVGPLFFHTYVSGCPLHIK